MKRATDTGAYTQEHARARARTRRASKVDERLIRALCSVLETGYTTFDIGAGNGRHAEALRAKGHAVIAYDGAALPELNVLEWDLSKPLQYRDGVDCQVPQGYMIEVGEHIPAELEATVIENITRAITMRLVVSWATPGQPGSGHVNCKTPLAVIEAFEMAGWMLDEYGTYKARMEAADFSRFGWSSKLVVFER